jgi:membrane associated rhomboid family serine protease
MRSASVGFQCPDDVAAGAKSVRQPRTVFGGRVAGDTQAVSLALLGTCVVVFVLQLAVGDLLGQRFGALLGPVRLQDGSVGGVADGEPYRVLTSAFFHVGPLHLLMNMGALVSLGPGLEAAFGRARFLVLYLLSAVGGSVCVLLLSNPAANAMGASGALFGLMPAALLAARKVGADTTFVRQYLMIGVVFSVAAPLLGFPLSWEGHLGGALTGAAVGAVLVHAPRQGRTLWQAAGCLAIAVLLAALAVLAVTLRTSALG